MQGKGKKPVLPALSARSNAAGYAKRKSLKSKSKPLGSAQDVYEYEPEKTRRAKIKLQLGKDELAGAGPSSGFGESGSEDEGDGGSRKRLHPRLVGEKDDEEELGEDEDEDIDSDQAFDESDEERFAGFEFSRAQSTVSRKKTGSRDVSRSVRFAEVDLNEESNILADVDNAGQIQNHADRGSDEESEEEEEEGEPDEFIDVLDILDGRGEPESEDDAEGVRGQKTSGLHLHNEATLGQGRDEGSAGDSDDEDGDVDSDHAPLLSEDEAEADDSALHNLENFITSLDSSQKRKAPEDEPAAHNYFQDDRSRKRRILKERTQVGTESEFAAHPGSTKLNLDDLLAPLAPSSTLQSLRKSVKVLASSSGKIQTLAAPLPQRTQEKLDREAAYEQTKEEIDKWSATMKRIKEAEHLSFPLQAEPQGKVSNLELAAKFKPTTELESAVDRLLKSAKMRDQDLVHTEALKMNHLSVEEVAARRAELAKMRELMFRAEAKAKRVAKIKSKTYRRIKKKEKEKLAMKLGEMEADEDDEDVRMRMEVDRAKERATLRHKNTGKWAKAMKARGELDDDQRRDINDMLDRGEKLKRRIQGQGSGSEDDSEEDDGDGSDVGEANSLSKIKASAFNELEQLDIGDGDASAGVQKSKSVFEMKFMQDAMAREKQRADQMADDFVRELGREGEDMDDDGEGQVLHLAEAGVQRTGGRMSFRPGNLPRTLPSLSMASDTSSVTLKSTDLFPDPPAGSPMTLSPIVERGTPCEDVNPWLAPIADSSVRPLQKRHEVSLSKASAVSETSKNKLRKRVKKREEERAMAKEDATVDISMADVLSLGKEKAIIGPSHPPPQRAKDLVVDQEEDSDVHSEAEAQEQVLNAKGKGRAKGVQSFKQRDLVARAFAGDNVVREFADEKRREMEADAPKEVDTTLAGWGSWGGAGVKKAPPKPFLIRKVAGVDPKARADYNKAHVIISERRDKKAAKYLVKDLPYPYTSKAQFERSMDTPLGSEWNTRVGFQRGTLPKVVKKMGTVITPLEKLF